MSGAAEKRKSSRKAFNVPVTLRVLGEGPLSGRILSVSTRDLSATGLSFDYDKLMALGTELEASLSIPGRRKPVVAFMRVVRVESDLKGEHFRLGAAFVELMPAERDFIIQAMEKVNIRALLEKMEEMHGSDLHLTVGMPPVVRAGRQLVPLDMDPLDDGQIRAMLYPLMDDRKIELLEKNLDLNDAFSTEPGKRYRANLHFQKGYLEAAIRNISREAQDFESLGLPGAQLENLLRDQSGLILLAGKVASGKTTSLAAIIQHLNKNYERVIVTVEDPIEYVFSNDKSIIKQRELGRDTRSYASALRNSLRQDPDVIVVSELLDRESLTTALSAAESGHLVIATVHAASTVQAFEKLLNFFPADQASSACRKLAASLTGLLFQMLVPRTEGGMALASELLIMNPAARNVIQLAQFHQLPGIIEAGGTYGMYTLDSSIERLVRTGEVSPKKIEAL